VVITTIVGQAASEFPTHSRGGCLSLFPPLPVCDNPAATCAADDMGELTKSVIERMKSAMVAEDLDDWVWKAADLLARARSAGYRSGFAEIDDEAVSPEERDELRQALLDALTRNADPGFVSPIIWALGKACDESLKQLYVDYLARYLESLKASNGVVYQALIALDNIGEPVRERNPDGTSSQSVIDVDKNIRQAPRYLKGNQIR